jgi:hypothetical protein
MPSPDDKDTFDMNRDPITGEPGAHPLGTGVGATSGAIAGATLGAAGGPVGMAVVGALGAVAGALGGKAAGEALNPTGGDPYWRSIYEKELDHDPDFNFEDYAPAYRLGYEHRGRAAGQNFDEIEGSMAAEWELAKGESRLSWQQARLATRAAWNHVERALPGDPNPDVDD